MTSYFKPIPLTKAEQKKAISKWAKAVKERDNYTCQVCGIYDENVHAHHKKTRGSHPELKTDLSNGISLCYKCHFLCHSGEIKLLIVLNI